MQAYSPPVKLKLPMWIYKWLTVIPVVGFFGLDHWAVGSNFTGVAKLVVNMLTFGSWYAYDIVQAWSATREDGKTVQSGGLRAPFGFYDGIGKNMFDSENLENLGNNGKLWLCIMGVGIFGMLYYITGFFLTKESGIVSNILFGIATVSFYGALLLAAFTMYFFFSKYIPVSSDRARATVNPFGSIPSSTTGVGKLLTAQAVSGTLPQFGGTEFASTELGIQEGGGYDAMIETTRRVFEVPKVSNDHLYFGLILLLLPLCGFTAYLLIKNNKADKKDEVSGDTRAV